MFLVLAMNLYAVGKEVVQMFQQVRWWILPHWILRPVIKSRRRHRGRNSWTNRLPLPRGSSTCRTRRTWWTGARPSAPCSSSFLSCWTWRNRGIGRPELWRLSAPGSTCSSTCRGTPTRSLSQIPKSLHQCEMALDTHLLWCSWTLFTHNKFSVLVAVLKRCTSISVFYTRCVTIPIFFKITSTLAIRGLTLIFGEPAVPVVVLVCSFSC